MIISLLHDLKSPVVVRMVVYEVSHQLIGLLRKADDVDVHDVHNVQPVGLLIVELKIEFSLFAV